MKKTAGTLSVQKDQAEGRQDWILELLDWLKYILVAVLIGLFLVIFVAQRNAVVGDSMEPTLEDRDQLLVEKVSKWFGGIDYADIITVSTRGLEGHDGSANIIKRVIGMPGDFIEIKEGQVFRNDVLVEESYLVEGTVTQPRPQHPEFSSLRLASDEYYVLGDNREISLDSRNFGPVQKESLIGKVVVRFYPFTEIGIP